MKKSLILAIVCILMGSTLMTSCIGSFTLTNKLLSWNKQISNKFVNELVFIAFWILPVYEVSGIADILVLNSIEFWSGDNPVASKSRIIEGNDGKYLVSNDSKGYTIKSLTDNSEVRLNFDTKTQAWSMVLPNGTEQILFSYVDENHIALPAPGTDLPVIVETSESGIYAYQAIAGTYQFASR